MRNSDVQFVFECLRGGIDFEKSGLPHTADFYFLWKVCKEEHDAQSSRVPRPSANLNPEGLKRRRTDS